MSRALVVAALVFVTGCSSAVSSSGGGSGGSGGSNSAGGGTGGSNSAMGGGTGGSSSGVGGGTGGGGTTGSENCTNLVDDDNDQKTDCADPDCFSFAQCCFDTCTDGTSICDTGGVRTCALNPATGCRAFGAATACNGGLLCSGGGCVATCTNQCTLGAKQCGSSGSVVECKTLPSGCTDWALNPACPQGQACSGGTCVVATSCTNQCTQAATRCTAGGQFQQCVQLMSGCTDWTFPAMCASGQTCAQPATTCAAPPMCTQGAVRCNATTPAVETCDAQGNWLMTQSCAQACQAGACTTSATCTAGTVRCNGSNVEVCSASGSAWLFKEICNTGCNLGLCTDPCGAGQRRCNGNNVETCTDAGVSWAAMPLPDAGSPACTNGCYKGDCMEADLVIDGITTTLEGDLSFKNSVIVKNGGQLKVGPSGQLSIRAKTISVADSASQINANFVGDQQGTPQTISVFSYCSTSSSSYNCCNAVGYGNTNVTCVNGTTAQCSRYGGGYNPCQGLGTFVTTVRSDDLSAEEGAKYGPTSPGGGVVRLIAEGIELKGQFTSNGTSPGTGGTILMAADTFSGNGAIQSTGASNGHIKILRGATDGFTGSTTGTVVKSVMPPLDVVSGSHSDRNRFYNDGLGDMFLAWTKPFATVNGYYYKVTNSPSLVPSPANATLIQAETVKVLAKDLPQGTTYFHIVSVDSAFNVGSVKNTHSVNINTEPPTIASSSHVNQRTWYPNPSIFFSWTNPEADSNFTGYYTAFDKFADTVPTPVQANFTSNKQVILSNTPDGIWVFHIVNRDTRNAITKAARHFVVYVGAEPAKENISGSVFDASNNNAPLSGVTITVNRGLFNQTSTGAGTYTFGGNLYVGSWELTASKTGYLPQKKMVTLAAGTPLNENFTLTKAP